LKDVTAWQHVKFVDTKIGASLRRGLTGNAADVSATKCGAVSDVLAGKKGTYAVGANTLRRLPKKPTKKTVALLGGSLLLPLVLTGKCTIYSRSEHRGVCLLNKHNFLLTSNAPGVARCPENLLWAETTGQYMVGSTLALKTARYSDASVIIVGFRFENARGAQWTES